MFLLSCACGVEEAPSNAIPAAEQQAAGWRSLFDGRTLNGWKPTVFGGEGAVSVRDGRILLEAGDPLTGITWPAARSRA
jgi:hypothetical protein